MKTLYIITKGMGKQAQEEIIRLEKENRHPRVTYFERAISAELLDERYLFDKTPWIRRWLYYLIPVGLAQVIETLFIHHRYDAVFSHSERVGLPLGIIFRLLRIQTPHVMILCRVTSAHPKTDKRKKWFLKKAQHGIDLIVCWSSIQCNIVIHELDIPSSKVKHIKSGTDQQFWHPIDREANTICSVGMEMRDYPTLVKALSDTDIPCHIATGAHRGQIFNTVSRLYEMDGLPSNITVGRRYYEELRELYSRSRFLVIPLLPTDSDNGLTAILEAMSMGKPVICSRVEGQVDIIEEGVSGIFVPQGDPDALREAIVSLWNDPKRAAEMGKAARKYIEEHHRWEDYGENIRRALLSVIGNVRPIEEVSEVPKAKVKHDVKSL